MQRYRETRAKRSHEELLPFQKAQLLVKQVYRLTANYPRSEQHGLQSQMRRAAVSVVSNIAEGAGRGTPRDFLRFLRTARASLAELIAQIELSDDLGFLSAEQTDALLKQADNASYFLNTFINHKRNNSP